MRMRFSMAGTSGLAGRIVAGTSLLGLVLVLASPVRAQDPQSKTAGSKITRASQEESRKHVDGTWVKKAFLSDMMEHWLTVSVMPNGFIQENLDREWNPWGTQREASLNGQGRV